MSVEVDSLKPLADLSQPSVPQGSQLRLFDQACQVVGYLSHPGDQRFEVVPIVVELRRRSLLTITR